MVITTIDWCGCKLWGSHFRRLVKVNRRELCTFDCQGLLFEEQCFSTSVQSERPVHWVRQGVSGREFSSGMNLPKTETKLRDCDVRILRVKRKIVPRDVKE